MAKQLRERVARGVAWSLGEKILSLLLQAGVGILVARLLSPEDYGVMAILTVFVTLSLVVVDSGFSQTLIRAENPSDGEFRAVFGFNLLTSLLLYGGVLLAAPWLADFYQLPILKQLTPILFLLLPINALCVIQQTMLTRRFRFDRLSRIYFLSNLFGGLLAVGMALGGWGVWSLVGQRLGAMASKAVMLWGVNPWRPSPVRERGALRRMAPYSLRLLLTDLITTLYNNISQLFVGKIYSAQTLGYYNQGQKLKEMPSTALLQSIQQVTFPALAKIQGDREKFRESYRQLLTVVAFGVFPVMVGLIAIAPDLFALLLGEKWMPTVPYFEILSLAGLFAPLAAVAYNVLKVQSDGRVIVRLEVIKRVVMTLILVLTIPRGVVAIAWGVVAMAAVEWGINSWAAARYASLSWGAWLRTLLPATLLSGGMYGAVKGFAGAFDLPLWVDLGGQILLGALLYGGLAWLLRLEAVQIARAIWRNR